MALPEEQLRRIVSEINRIHPDSFSDPASVTLEQLAEFNANNPDIFKAATDNLLPGEVAASGPAVAKARDYINANIDAYNQEIEAITHLPNGAPATPEAKAALKIEHALPTGTIELHNPAFIKAARKFIAFKGPGQEAFKDLAFLMPLMAEYSAIYEELGDDAPVSKDPLEMRDQRAIYQFKLGIKELKDPNKIFGDRPDFDPKTDPFNPVEPDFIAAFKAITEKNETPEQKHALENMGDFYKSKLPPAAQTAISDALGTSAPTDLDPAPQTDPNAPPTIESIFPQIMRDQVFTLKKYFRNRSGAGLGPGRYDQSRVPDELFDFDTRKEILEIIQKAFTKYGTEYKNGTKAIEVTNEQGAVTAFYTVDGQGNLYAVPWDEDENGNKKPRRDNKGKLIRLNNPEKDHIEDGILALDRRDGIGRRPHEATITLFNQFIIERTLKETADLEELKKIKDEQERRIKEFFAANAALADYEEDFLALLRNSDIQNLNGFKNSELGKRIRKGKEDDNELDILFADLFHLETTRRNFINDNSRFTAEAYEVDQTIVDLFRSMRDPSYGMEPLAGLTAKYMPEDDKILAYGAYKHLHALRHGEYMPTRILYQGGSAAQKAAIEKHFTGPDGKVYEQVSREQVEAFVLKQFKLNAIKEISRHDGSDLSSEEQDKFIAQHRETLRKVSRAMEEGHFTPYGRTTNGSDTHKADLYPRDVEIAFRALNTPPLDHERVLNVIAHSHANGNVPPPEYVRDVLTEGELKALTGLDNFTDFSLEKQDEILKARMERSPREVINGLTPGSDAYEAYKRVYFNYHDMGLANFMFHRNGEVDDRSDNTWNGVFGGPSDDVKLHLFMRYNIDKLGYMFDHETAEMFTNVSGTRINYDLTYKEVEKALREAGGDEYVNKLKEGMENLESPSTYTYLREIRIDHAYQLRLENIERKAHQRALEELEENEAKAEAEAEAKAKKEAEKKADSKKDGDPGAKDDDAGPDAKEEEHAAFRSQQENEALAQALAVVAGVAVPVGHTMFTQGRQNAVNNLANTFASTIPDQHKKAAANAARAFEIADNTLPGSDKYKRAMNIAKSVMKRTGLKEQDIRLYGIENGKPIVADAKIDAAHKAVQALEEAQNAQQGTTEHRSALKKLAKIRKDNGLTKAQIELFARAKADPNLAILTQPTAAQAISNAQQHAAQRIWNVLKTADGVEPNSDYHKKAVKTAERLLKKHGLTEQQVRIHGVRNGGALIPNAKLGAAHLAAQALEEAQNAQQGSTEHRSALKKLATIRKSFGLTKAQIELFAKAHNDPKLAVLTQSADPQTGGQPSQTTGAGPQTPDDKIKAQQERFKNKPKGPKSWQNVGNANETLERAAKEGAEATQPETKTTSENNSGTEKGGAQSNANKEKNFKDGKRKGRKGAVRDRRGARGPVYNFNGSNYQIQIDNDEARITTGTQAQQGAEATTATTAADGADTKPAADGAETKAAADGAETKPAADGAETKAAADGADGADTKPAADGADNAKAAADGADGADNTKPAAENADNGKSKIKTKIKNKAADFADAAKSTTKSVGSKITMERTGNVLMGVGTAYSGYHALSNFDEDGNGAFTARAAVTTADAAVTASAWRGTSGMFTNALLKAGGAPLIAATSIVEAGVAINNKDGETAGAAATIGTTAATGAAIGSFGTPVGTIIGGISGTIVGLGLVLTDNHKWLGRWYNEEIYRGAIQETQKTLARSAQFRTELEGEGNVSGGALSEYKEFIREIEDDIMDYKKTEAALRLNASQWNSPDDGDTARQDLGLLDANLKIQKELRKEHALLTRAYNQQRHKQLNELFKDVNNPKDLTTMLRSDFNHVTQNLTWDSKLVQVKMFWENANDWRDTLIKTGEKIGAYQGTPKDFNISSLGDQKILELTRELHNTREKVEDRINYFLVKASKSELNSTGYKELERLKEDLEEIVKYEKILWKNDQETTPATPGPTDTDTSPGIPSGTRTSV